MFYKPVKLVKAILQLFSIIPCGIIPNKTPFYDEENGVMVKEKLLIELMVTIANTDFKSNLSLSSILAVKTKADMLKICKTLDLYVSPNLKKDETARRLANELLHSPEAILYSLCKAELQI